MLRRAVRHGALALGLALALTLALALALALTLALTLILTLALTLNLALTPTCCSLTLAGGRLYEHAAGGLQPLRRLPAPRVP